MSRPLLKLKPPKLHYLNDPQKLEPFCKQLQQTYEPLRFTTNVSDVECLRCRKKMNMVMRGLTA